MRISVIGLGKLGSPMVASLASRGHEVIGVDVNPASVAAINSHRAPVVETGLQKMIDENRARISATTDWDKAILGTDASLIIVPTPSQPDGAFSNKFVVEACNNIGGVLKHKKDFHLVVVVSTMMPGSSRNEIIPVLENASGKRVGVDFGYCYSPSLVALGNVIQNFLNPEVVMIGANDPRSADMLDAIYRATFISKPEFHKVTPSEVELAKIAINTFITTKISFANMLGMIADKMEDVNVHHVTKILGNDSRIGAKYFKSGGSYGGPCFPRDNRALSRGAELIGVKTYIPQATDMTNKQYIEQLAEKTRLALAGVSGTMVGIVGIAYKPDTDVVEEGMGLHLAKNLIDKGVAVTLYDPAASDAAKRVFGNTAHHADSLEACLATSHVVVITNPYREHFSEIDPMLMDGKAFIDCWGVLQGQKFETRTEVIPFALTDMGERAKLS